MLEDRGSNTQHDVPPTSPISSTSQVFQIYPNPPLPGPHSRCPAASPPPFLSPPVNIPTVPTATFHKGSPESHYCPAQNTARVPEPSAQRPLMASPPPEPPPPPPHPSPTPATASSTALPSPFSLSLPGWTLYSSDTPCSLLPEDVTYALLSTWKALSS